MKRFVKRAAIGLLVAMGVQSPAMPSDWGSDLPEARLSWNLGFGGSAGIPGGYGYGFGLAYRINDLEAPATMVAFNVANRVAQLRLGGVPVFERTYRQVAAEDIPEEVIEEEAPETAAESSSPSWGWWAAGAAVALVVAASTAGGEGEHEDFENPGTTGVTTNSDGTWVGCVEGTCAVCPDGDVAESCGDAYVAADLLPMRR